MDQPDIPVPAVPATGPTTEITTEQVSTRRGKVQFLQQVFSDDGTPSSSRILTFILALAVLVIVAGLCRHICALTDTVALGLWLSALPVIIAALVGLMAAPYAINRSAGTLSDLANIFKR